MTFGNIKCVTLLLVLRLVLGLVDRLALFLVVRAALLLVAGVVDCVVDGDVLDVTLLAVAVAVTIVGPGPHADREEHQEKGERTLVLEKRTRKEQKGEVKLIMA